MVSRVAAGSATELVSSVASSVGLLLVGPVVGDETAVAVGGTNIAAVGVGSSGVERSWVQEARDRAAKSKNGKYQSRLFTDDLAYCCGSEQS